jgi:ProP effector
MPEMNLPAPSAEEHRQVDCSAGRPNDPPNTSLRTDLASAKATLAALADLFPELFAAEGWQPHKPLKIGISNDLVERGVLLPVECKALRYYTMRRQYQVALASGGPRYDLDGNPAGEVTAEQMAAAAKIIECIDVRRAELAAAARFAREADHAKRRAAKEAKRAKDAVEFVAARRAARAVVEKSAGPTPPEAPRRLTLADLKIAAQARKQMGAPR